MSTRTKRPPKYLKDYYCNINIFNTSSRVKYPLNFILSYNKLSPSCKPFVMSISSDVEPNTYFEGVKYDCWRKAISVRYLLWSQIKRGILFFFPRTKLS